MDKKVVKRSVLSYAFLFIVILGVFFFINMLNNKVNKLTYSEFLKELKDGKVTELTITPNNNESVYSLSGKLEGYNENETFNAQATLSEETIKQIYETKADGEVDIKVAKDPGSSWIVLFIVNLLPIILLIGIGYFLISRQMGSANKSMDFGRSRARLTSDKDKVKFDKVAGLTEEKEEVQELIDFLKEPKKFQKMGARISKGLLLVGPPGTGKT